VSLLELRARPQAVGLGRSFLPSDVFLDCLDTRRAIHT